VSLLNIHGGDIRVVPTHLVFSSVQLFTNIWLIPYKLVPSFG